VSFPSWFLTPLIPCPGCYEKDIGFYNIDFLPVHLEFIKTNMDLFKTHLPFEPPLWVIKDGFEKLKHAFFVRMF